MLGQSVLRHGQNVRGGGWQSGKYISTFCSNISTLCPSSKCISTLCLSKEVCRRRTGKMQSESLKKGSSVAEIDLGFFRGDEGNSDNWNNLLGWCLLSFMGPVWTTFYKFLFPENLRTKSYAILWKMYKYLLPDIIIKIQTCLKRSRVRSRKIIYNRTAHDRAIMENLC